MTVVATYRILYWQDIPSQIRSEDEEDEDSSLPLGRRFQDHIDAVATQRGLNKADYYLAEWEWSDKLEREGPAQDVAEAVRAELESQASW
jgi:hypothetical protein